MYHIIEFLVTGLAELEMPDQDRPVRVLIRKGTRVRAKIRPYVMESRLGPVEVADLLSDDGSAARAVRFASFRFVDR